ncbi:MmgE/PrpD family protein [Pseudonocardia acaciae]|uniref:MmgE/PrpD family protein n=1 Tax=Pseudonocardia acaciae TaxID=551276 RepID=UPI0006866A40|nr:MmgE/PrpD family protein [Pseudonocardia acaciae]
MTGTDAHQLAEWIEQLARAACAVRLEDIGPEGAASIGLIVADTVGVIHAGARSPEMTKLIDHELARSAPGEASVLAPGGPRADAETAAWLNGSAVAFLEMDEGFRPTGHPAAHVVPAALAAAQAVGAPGARLVEAVAAGYEVAARLFEAFVFPKARHPHGHLGALGAATAVARIHGADPVPSVRIAATQPLLTGWDACYAGATARNLWIGHANRIGVAARAWADAGFTGATGSLAATVVDSLADPRPLTDSIDPIDPADLRLRRNYFKLHSSCALAQGAIDATLDARARLGLTDPARLRSVEVATVTANMRIARQAEPNALSTRFSVPYAVAAALVHGEVGPAQMDWDPKVAELAERVSVTLDEDLDARWPTAAPARVTLATDAGTAEATVLNPKGHHANPATPAELEDKFALLTGSRASFRALAALADQENCADLPLPA